MRLKLAPLVFAVALVVGCATPAPELPPPDPLAITVPEPPAPPEPPVIVAQPLADTAFPPNVADSLEALPPPQDDLWDRIRKGFAMSDLDDPRVAKWEEWYASRPDYVARMVDRSRRYLYYIVVEVQERGMPAEIALLPMIESAFNPNALSTSRASGIWQFIPSTGRLYGMQQSFWFDSRRDVVAGTDGALTYLTKLHTDFDDWQLALAAYNCGEGNVGRAIAQNQKKGRPTDYSNLNLPNETRDYLPKLQAVKNIVRDPAKYGIVLDDIPDAPYFAIVKTTKRVDVKRAAELAEMSEEEFQFLNPHFNRPVIAGAEEYTILLPIDKAELFAAKLDLTDQPLVTWQAYRMRNGETLAQVAAKFDLPVETLRAVNGLGARTKPPPGHTLLVPSARPSNDGNDGLAQAVFTTVPQGRTFYYKVKRGDTIAQIANRYDVSVADIRRWNGLTQASVNAGQSLRITSDLAPNAARAKRATGRKPSAPMNAKSPGSNGGTAAPPRPASAGSAAKPPTRSAKSPEPAGG